MDIATIGCSAVCNEETVPRFLKGTGRGWVTGEYGMLPRSTGSRMRREASGGKQGGRTMEIQRLIGRALRAGIDLKVLGENTISLDCDVIQADGGTRTASITGAWVALNDAIHYLLEKKIIDKNPLHHQIASVSVGIFNGTPVLDLDYAEDSDAQADANFVMTGKGGIVEVQGTAETEPFSQEQFDALMALARAGIADLVKLQKMTIA